jgi:Asp-tRNA(Asn)/Glu-tRNA(Gln) amidotransferase A subunit family amidase
MMIVGLLAALSLAATPPAAIDRDLTDISVKGLHALYRTHHYSVRQVVRWHLDRLRRYNGVYKVAPAILTEEALGEADREDAQARRPGFRPQALWGVPIVIKANNSIKGHVTTAGWRGFMLPGHELVAPRDATIVARLRAAGAIIIGVTNMPDFAASDTTRSTAFGRTGNAYDVRFSPGGSSGGTVTSVTGNMAVLGTGTDTGNSIRMPVATSNLVGIFPTRGLVSIAGIAPLDSLLDNAGPIARNVSDAAIMLDAIVGEDALDPITAGSARKAEPGPYNGYLRPGALRGKRFAVPAFILDGESPVFQGICAGTPADAAAKARHDARVPLKPETRAAFLRAVAELRAAGATMIIDPNILPDDFADMASQICTLPYLREGYDHFLADFGPAEYRSVAAYEKATGHPLPPTAIGGAGAALSGQPNVRQARLEDDPAAERTYLGPRRALLARYLAEMDRLHLDGFVYPAIQMPPPDETMPQDHQLSGGPHSATDWVNMIGVPAISIPAGFYEDGLPFGIEFSARPWRDGDLISWAYDYERLTHHRRRPVLVEQGLLPDAAKPLDPSDGP